MALQKGRQELKTKSGKEGLWAGGAAADGSLAEETLLVEDARHALAVVQVQLPGGVGTRMESAFPARMNNEFSYVMWVPRRNTPL